MWWLPDHHGHARGRPAAWRAAQGTDALPGLLWGQIVMGDKKLLDQAELEARIKQHEADGAVLEHAMNLLQAYCALETKTSRLRQENRELQAQVEALSKPGTHGAIVKWVHEFAEHPCGRSPVMSDSPIDHIVEHVESLNEMIATTQYSEDALWECLGLVDWTALDLPAGQVTKITDAIGIQDAKLVLAALKPKPGRGRS